MEMNIESTISHVPCTVTVEPRKEIYELQTFDTSKRSFANGHELLAWIKRNWEPVQFQNPTEYQDLIHAITTEMKQS
ncbi:hypothetical protein N0O92_10260 [Alkalihalobacillus sp. MEB130]|uniref:hypothetical protein n=1 Tax=Alkalihalobacillus sp. MEB130 TaxID=2976704 RepID=UPI0028DE03AC|nr:hypothetical protein [Alkalihalobacillus sp. MEB130]MDT8860617.1 hypothetical protein [Alkalihalobacillus sp. MEB130]